MPAGCCPVGENVLREPREILSYEILKERLVGLPKASLYEEKALVERPELEEKFRESIDSETFNPGHGSCRLSFSYPKRFVSRPWQLSIRTPNLERKPSITIVSGYTALQRGRAITPGKISLKVGEDLAALGGQGVSYPDAEIHLLDYSENSSSEDHWDWSQFVKGDSLVRFLQPGRYAVRPKPNSSKKPDHSIVTIVTVE